MDLASDGNYFIAAGIPLTEIATRTPPPVNLIISRKL
jgi:hypothetical protein